MTSGEERFDLVAEALIVPAGLAQECVARLGRTLERGAQDVLYALPAVFVHRPASRG